MLDSMYDPMSISTGMYPKLDLWNENKLQSQLQFAVVQFMLHQNKFFDHV
jgi:hypothetical protein